MEPLISVIVPVYNAEKYLDRCIKSILNQTYKCFEIILVDDGSSDNCPQMCDKWATADNRIKVVHKQNAGAAAARNTGIKTACGDIMAFVDADDWIAPEMYYDMVNRLLSDNSDIVVCGNEWILENGQVLKIETNERCVIDEKKSLEYLLDDKLKEQVWDKIYKKEVIDGIQFVEGRKIDDIFWTYRVLGNAKKISIVDKVYYSYYQNVDSVMGVGYRSYRLDALDANKLRCEYIKKRFPELYDKALCVYIGSCHYQLQCAIRTNQPNDVINNIMSRTSFRKTGHPTRGITFKQKIWFYLFTFFPITTCKLRNRFGIGL